MSNKLALVAACLLIVGCNGSTPTPPTSPTPPAAPSPPPQNRMPEISSASVSPEFAVAGLATITYSVSATDPDNDPLTFRWTFGDVVRNDATGTFPATNPVSLAQLSVTDSRGASTTRILPLVVANLTGTWRGTDRFLGNYTFVLTQTGIVVTGTYQDPEGGGRVRPEDGRVDQNGNIQLRVKQEPFLDYFFRGQVDRTTGMTITGGIFESGFSGHPFTIAKQ